MRDIEEQIRAYGTQLLADAQVVDAGGVFRSVPRRRRTNHRQVVLVAAAVAVVALIGIAALVRDRRDVVQVDAVGGPTTTWSLPALGNPPHVLVTAPGWQVTGIYEDGESGEMDVQNADQGLELSWYPVGSYEEYVADRRAGASREVPITVGGHEGVLFQDDGDLQRFDALWPAGDFWFELRGGPFASEDEFRAVAATLEPVDDETWLAAMPDGWVVPAERAAVVEETLADIPAPPSLDVAALSAGDAVTDRYQVEVAVVAAVACGWVEQWVAATARADTAAVEVAVTAMGSSHSWAVLEAMDPDPTVDSFTYADTVWEVADAMPTNARLPSGETIEDQYRTDFLCDGVDGSD